MFSIQIDERPSKKCRISKDLGTIAAVEQSEAVSLEVNHPPQIIELVIHDSEESSSSSSESESDDAEIAADTFWTTEVTASEYYSKFVARDWDSCLAEMQAPQRSELWLTARKNCITASQFGSAVGNNPYSTPDAMLVEKLWKPFEGNDATRYGTLHEPCAEKSFIEWLYANHTRESHVEFAVREYGLLKHPSLPWIGVSPDGILYKVDHAHKKLSW